MGIRGAGNGAVVRELASPSLAKARFPVISGFSLLLVLVFAPKVLFRSSSPGSLSLQKKNTSQVQFDLSGSSG